MDGDPMMEEEERQGLLNQLSLDLLLRRLGSIVLRRKFKEIYAKLNDGKEWTDGPEAGEKFCQSKWGNGAYVKANLQQQEMMQEGNIQNWDLHCLQSVITKMLTTALEDKRKQDQNNIPWDDRWWAQMSKIRQLANIRHSIAHMPNETLTQGDFEEKWENAVDALRALGAKSKEIKKILQITQSAFNLPSLTHQGQGSLSNSQKETLEKIKESQEEEIKVIEKLRAKIVKLQLENQSRRQLKGQNDVETKNKQEEVKNNGNDSIANVSKVVVNKKNELRADTLTKNGDLASKSEDWDKALEFYTRALEIPGISDKLQRKIYINRSWVHLKVLQMPEPPFKVNLLELGECESTEKKSNSFNLKLHSQVSQSTLQRKPQFLDKKLLKMDHQKWPKKLTDEMKELHLTAGIADAESALKLSPGQKSPNANYRLAQFHQLKGDWKTALTFFDLALDQSDLDSQLEFDRNVCQLELLNQAEVEEFHWIPGQKNQTMAGLAISRNPKKWRDIMDTSKKDPQQQLQAQVVKAHFLAQGISWEDNQRTREVTQQTFDQVVKLYEEAASGNLPSSFYCLGLLLQEGNGAQKDFSSAVRFFKMAANFPIIDKTAEQKESNLQGTGAHQVRATYQVLDIGPNFPVIGGGSSKILEWQKMAVDWATEGIVEAQYRLGLCYEFGLGVGKDEKKALHWFEMASLGNYGKASRKLGNIYSQGLLGVPKDMDMALFCREYAFHQGDILTMSSSALHYLLPPHKPIKIWASIHNMSSAITLNSRNSTPFMMAAMSEKKQHFQSVLADLLQEIRQFDTNFQDSEEREPEGVSWNIPAFIEHTLHMTHLLELAQTPEFKQKMEAIPNPTSLSTFTGRLMMGSKSCAEALTAFQELNKLYREALIITNGSQCCFDTKYPPDLRVVPGISKAIMAREGQLVASILFSFSSCIRLIGAAFLMDQPTLTLICRLSKKFCNSPPVAGVAPNDQEMLNYESSVYIFYYSLLLEGMPCTQIVDQANPDKKSLVEPIVTIFAATVQASLGKFEAAAGDLKKYLKKVRTHLLPSFYKSDLLFVQALCCKSAGLTRGVHSANRKKVNEAMTIFQEFLSICPKDEPRRAEAHYQLGLCTLYLEKMKVKGQSSVSMSTAKDILTKVRLHFTRGKAAEQDLPWKDLQCPYDPPVKLLLQQKMKELETLVQNIPAQNLTLGLQGQREKSERSCYGRLVDPCSFKFPTSSFALKLREKRRVEVITTFRKFFKAAREKVGPIDSTLQLSAHQRSQLEKFYSSSENPFSWRNMFPLNKFVGYYKIVEPILHFCITPTKIEGPVKDIILAFTVVQDESGAVFNLSLVINYRASGDKDGQFGLYQVGNQIIISRPFIQLDVDGRTSLIIHDAETQVFHLPLTCNQQPPNGGPMTRNCGFCGKIGRIVLRCSKCQAVYYCGTECQAGDWKELKHNLICPFLKQQPPSTLLVSKI